MNETPQPGKTVVDLRQIIEWYRSHCDESWQHQYGVRLEAVDNPGWLLKVDLTGTSLEGRTMPELREGIAPEDHPMAPEWLHCCVRDNQFQGSCDPTQLARLFELFYQFIRSNEPSDGGT